MREAIADTGPVLHLHEIGRLDCLAVFDSLLMPDLVVEELHTYGLDPSGLTVAGLHVVVGAVAREEWAPGMTEAGEPIFHPAGARVFILSQAACF